MCQCTRGNEEMDRERKINGCNCKSFHWTDDLKKKKKKTKNHIHVTVDSCIEGGGTQKIKEARFVRFLQ